MKALSGSATQVVAVPIEDCFELLVAVERYPQWHPDVVRSVEVVQRDGNGRATQARTDLHVGLGPVTKDFHLLMAVQTDPPRSVDLQRVPHDASDPEEFAVRWRLQQDERGTRIRLEVEANLSVPRLLPVGGIGDAMAGGFVSAAARELGSG